MNLKELLAHNYKVVKHVGREGEEYYSDFYVTYIQPDSLDEEVRIYWVTTRLDKNNGKWRARQFEEESDHWCTGMFSVESLNSYWCRQLTRYYELMEGLRNENA